MKKITAGRGILFQTKNNTFKHIQKFYYLFDDLGSVSAITNSEGIPIKHYHYDPYGNLTNTDNDPLNSFTFVGRYGGRKDWEIGFTQFLHRWYDAKTGKWISRDPIGATGGVNLYSYVSQNPVNIIDFTGLSDKVIDWVCVDDAAWSANYQLLDLIVTTATVGILQSYAARIAKMRGAREDIVNSISSVFTAGSSISTIKSAKEIIEQFVSRVEKHCIVTKEELERRKLYRRLNGEK